MLKPRVPDADVSTRRPLDLVEDPVSVHGSLDTFALPEVLGFLAATSKSGELYVSGNRTAGLAAMPALQGRLWLHNGRLVAADVAAASEVVDAVLELLWLVEGEFVFRLGTAPDPQMSADVGAVLADAQARAAEWREIFGVVPSHAAWLELAPEPPGLPVTLRADQWRLAVTVAGGSSVAATIHKLGLDGLPGFRAVREMVEAGLVTVSADGPAAPPGSAEPAATAGGSVARRTPMLPVSFG